ncbi:MAG TPA: FAD-binding oxidoreductase [Bacteroidetes bacterium]|jgi:glycolate oxidase|nr:FAD-binding oxidoreductase [Bacteroidota bacterium]
MNNGINTFNQLQQEHIIQLQNIIGAAYVMQEKDDLHAYSHDETEDLVYYPAAVVKPRMAEEVAAILVLAQKAHIPVTPMGARTGLSGGALPVCGGIALSMERFNSIIEIDERNLQVTVEPGVITQTLQDTLAEKGLFYPPDPASKGSCFIGGNVAENSGGPKAVKYGVVKDYVLNLEVVMADGSIIWTGANVLKNATGYNLTQLIVGSEGTLGVVTKIVLRLLPLPAMDKLLLIPFSNAVNACAAVSAVFRAGIIPSAMEFMEKSAFDLVLRYEEDLRIQYDPEAEAFLFVEVDGNNETLLMEDCTTIAALVETFGAGEIMMAESAAEKATLWSIRRKAGEAVKRYSAYKEEDTVVPRASLPNLLKKVKEIGSRFGFESYCYGHAGDGNLHVNIVKGTLSEEAWNEHLPVAIRELFQEVVRLGGTISAEHGIGLVQKGYMDIAFNEIQLDLFRKIKKVFDPTGILNPGKIID